jgi:hypothetical protein
MLGCGDTGTHPSDKILVVDFKLTDATANETSTFLLGQEMFFEFSIINQTGEDQAWTAEYDWPAARFTVHQGLDFLGNTYESMPQGAGEWGDVLENGDTLLVRASWLDHSYHAPLAVGEYTATAWLNYEFDALQPPRQWEADFTVEPAVAGATEIFAWYRRPMFGFCAPVNRIYHASVVRSADSLYTVSGTTLFDNSLLTMPCFDAGWTDNCFMQIPSGAKFLFPERAAALEQLLADFPVEEHEISPACDPCVINRYYIFGRVEEINPCASGSEQYWQTVAGIDTLMHQILYEWPDCTVVLTEEAGFNSDQR